MTVLAMGFGRMTTAWKLAVAATIAVIAVGTFAAWKPGIFSGAEIAPTAVAQSQPTPNPTSAAGGATAAPVLELAEKQLDLIKVAPVGEHVFPLQEGAVGSIDFDEDMSVQVFTPYQGKIIAAFAKVGDAVEKGKPLFTIDSPDLIQAESTLMAAAATFDQNNRALIRAQK